MTKIENGKLALTVASYNIAGGNFDKELTAIAKDILDVGADIVGVQEMDMFAVRSNKVDMLDMLLKNTGLEYGIFVKAIDLHKGGEYGTAIISKYPIVESEIIPLKTYEGGPCIPEGRSLGITTIDVLGEKVNFVNTHLSYEFREAIEAHFDQVAEILERFDSYIITADFNTNDFTLFEKFHDSHAVNNKEHELYSFPYSSTGGKGIDNIVMTKDWKWRDAGLGPLDHSDHRMLYATLEKEIWYGKSKLEGRNASRPPARSYGQLW